MHVLITKKHGSLSRTAAVPRTFSGLIVEGTAARSPTRWYGFPTTIPPPSRGNFTRNGRFTEVEWSEWSECSTSCGPGTQTRYSRCVDDGSRLELCMEAGGERTETRSCLPVQCDVPAEEPSADSDLYFSQKGSSNGTQNVTEEVAVPMDAYLPRNHTVVAKKHYKHHRSHPGRADDSKTWNVIKKRLTKGKGTWTAPRFARRNFILNTFKNFLRRSNLIMRAITPPFWSQVANVCGLPQHFLHATLQTHTGFRLFWGISNFLHPSNFSSTTAFRLSSRGPRKFSEVTRRDNVAVRRKRQLLPGIREKAAKLNLTYECKTDFHERNYAFFLFRIS